MSRPGRTSIVVLAAAVTLVAADRAALKSLAPPTMRIGAALNQAQSDGRDAVGVAIVLRQFNTISPENLLKWESVHPDPDRYDFDPADRYVEFGRGHGMFVVGHVLVWHQQTPAWVFAGEGGKKADRETLLARLQSHIAMVVGRYRGRIGGWDVVNEALDEDGTLRRTPWLEAIGEDYIAKAFEFAHAADPDAELYYNDYNLWKPAKREAAVRLVQALKAKGLRVDGIGEQGHWGIDDPPLAAIDGVLAAIRTSGTTLITELDIDVLPRDPDMWGADLSKQSKIRAATNIYPDGLPPAVQERLARRYADLFTLFLKHDVGRVTFWGVTDASSWLHNFPIPGRVNYPLLWDRDGREKPASRPSPRCSGRTPGGDLRPLRQNARSQREQSQAVAALRAFCILSCDSHDAMSALFEHGHPRVGHRHGPDYGPPLIVRRRRPIREIGADDGADQERKPIVRRGDIGELIQAQFEQRARQPDARTRGGARREGRTRQVRRPSLGHGFGDHGRGLDGCHELASERAAAPGDSPITVDSDALPVRADRDERARRGPAAGTRGRQRTGSLHRASRRRAARTLFIMFAHARDDPDPAIEQGRPRPRAEEQAREVVDAGRCVQVRHVTKAERRPDHAAGDHRKSSRPLTRPLDVFDDLGERALQPRVRAIASRVANADCRPALREHLVVGHQPGAAMRRPDIEGDEAGHRAIVPWTQRVVWATADRNAVTHGGRGGMAAVLLPERWPM